MRPDDEPAFPVKFGPDERNLDVEVYSGMSLRDFFAAYALTGILASHPAIYAADNASSIAKTALKFADAMLKARKE